MHVVVNKEQYELFLFPSFIQKQYKKKRILILLIVYFSFFHSKTIHKICDRVEGIHFSKELPPHNPPPKKNTYAGLISNIILFNLQLDLTAPPILYHVLSLLSFQDSLKNILQSFCLHILSNRLLFGQHHDYHYYY